MDSLLKKKKERNNNNKNGRRCIEVTVGVGGVIRKNATGCTWKVIALIYFLFTGLTLPLKAGENCCKREAERQGVRGLVESYRGICGRNVAYEK